MPSDRFRAVMEATSNVNDQFGVPMKGGKQYLMVKDRVQVFRQEFGDEFGIVTKVEYPEGFAGGAPIIANAFIQDKNFRVIASGWAVEFVGSTKLTDASPVEIAETSAIGRALACFGIQGSEYASFNEIEAHTRKAEFRDNRQSDMPDQYRGNGPDPSKVREQWDRQTASPESVVGRQRQQEKPIWYVPKDDQDLDRDLDMIIQEIERIDQGHELGRYWSELKPAVDLFKKSDVGMSVVAEIKAAMATRHNKLGAQR